MRGKLSQRTVLIVGCALLLGGCGYKRIQTPAGVRETNGRLVPAMILRAPGVEIYGEFWVVEESDLNALLVSSEEKKNVFSAFRARYQSQSFVWRDGEAFFSRVGKGALAYGSGLNNSVILESGSLKKSLLENASYEGALGENAPPLMLRVRVKVPGNTEALYGLLGVLPVPVQTKWGRESPVEVKISDANIADAQAGIAVVVREADAYRIHFTKGVSFVFPSWQLWLSSEPFDDPWVTPEGK